MSSMAQQAKPKSMYHCDEARPQFKISSTLVVKTVSGNEFINGFIGYLLIALGLNLLCPFLITFGPCVNQAKKENADKNQHLDQCKNPHPTVNPTAENRSHGKDESNFNLENDKD